MQRGFNILTTEGILHFSLDRGLNSKTAFVEITRATKESFFSSINFTCIVSFFAQTWK